MAAFVSRKCSFISILLLCCAGLGLSMYAYYVETSKETNEDFTAACDINEKMSCSKVFTSRYGKGFGLLEYVVGTKHWLNQPNSVYGVVFYVLQIFLCLLGGVNLAMIAILLAVMANCGSVYLAYILYFILDDFCVVCVSTYCVNFLLLVCCLARHGSLATSAVSSKRAAQKKLN